MNILNKKTIDNEIISWNEWSSAKCDKYDYLTAVSCGALAGIIDVLFVGDSSDSLLGDKVDDGADWFVEKAANFFYKHDNRENGKPRHAPDTLGKCISYLEQAFPVSYDARYASDLDVDEGVLKDMTPKNHHLKALAHSPDPVGLVFSIIDQFDQTGSFIDNGQIISAVPKKKSGAIPYMVGHDLPSKLFCGFVNWIGHMISDISGSSSTRMEGKAGRGMGIPMPFYNMFLMFDDTKINGMAIADLMTRVYESGYDLRFGVTMSIPVFFEEMAIRAIWAFRQVFQYGRPLNQCIPSGKHSDLRTMLLIGNLSFCLVDGADAIGRNFTDGRNANMVDTVCRMNLVGWTRLAVLLINEGLIRSGIKETGLPVRFIGKVFDKVDSDEIRIILKASGKFNEYYSCIHYIKTLRKTSEEYKLAKEERLRVEAECQAKIVELQKYHEEMNRIVEMCMIENLETFSRGMQLINHGADMNTFITGNVMIQEALGREVQFETEEEFEDLMESDDAFVF